MIFASERPIPGLDPALFKAKSDGTFWRWMKSHKKWRQVNLEGPRFYHVKFDIKRDGAKRVRVRFMAGATVLKSFGVPRPLGCECFWKDGDKTNNSLGNLCWEPAGASKIGSIQKSPPPIGTGSFNSQAILDEEDVSDIRSLRQQGYLMRDLACKYGVSLSTISNIFRRKSWTHIDSVSCEPPQAKAKRRK